MHVTSHRPSTVRRPRPLRRGFSLLELLIAIAILLAIGALVVVNLAPRRDQAQVDLTRGQLDQFAQAIKLFKLDLGRFPTEDEGLSVLWSAEGLEDEEEETKWKGPYLETPKPADDWGNEWVYMYPSEEAPGLYKILSLGPDGEEDTEDDITSFDRMLNADGELDEAFDNSFAEEGMGS